MRGMGEWNIEISLYKKTKACIYEIAAMKPVSRATALDPQFETTTYYMW